MHGGLSTGPRTEPDVGTGLAHAGDERSESARVLETAAGSQLAARVGHGSAPARLGTVRDERSETRRLPNAGGARNSSFGDADRSAPQEHLARGHGNGDMPPAAPERWRLASTHRAPRPDVLLREAATGYSGGRRHRIRQPRRRARESRPFSSPPFGLSAPLRDAQHNGASIGHSHNPKDYTMKRSAVILAVALAFGPTAADQATAGQTTDPLPSWNDGNSKRAIMAFVAKVTKEGSPDSYPPPNVSPPLTTTDAFGPSSRCTSNCSSRSIA